MATGSRVGRAARIPMQSERNTSAVFRAIGM
jgi:hypothetical protein